MRKCSFPGVPASPLHCGFASGVLRRRFMPSGSAWIGAGLACWGGAKFCAGSAVHRGASYTDVGSQFTFDGDSGRGFDASAAAAATAAPATPGSSACWAVLAASTELQRAKASSTQLLHCDLSSVRLFTGASRVCEMMPLSSAKKRSASAALCATASSATARNLTTPTHSSWCSLIRMVSSARERSTSRASAASAGSDSTSSYSGCGSAPGERFSAVST
mmetsp:Transcript_15271/g.58059  ORF Transcript_15271/g.58059 Transcript_15271/m.58059 type:complete len:219 (+) Transcript_15271:3881-4537(+)